MGSALSAALLPVEGLYRAAVSARNAAFDRGWLAAAEPPIPVVSIGNLAVGGAGKTPLSAWLAARLAARGLRPALVLSGYGEDEVLLHRELNPDVPVFVDARRIEAVRQAAAAGCGLAVVDDGFQHRALGRLLDIVLVAAESWTPTPRLLPRGPWREAPAALHRAHLVVVTRKTAPADAAARVAEEVRAASARAEAFVCALEPAGLSPLSAAIGAAPPSAELRGREVLAVASLADPGPFREQLGRMGARVELAAFPDHHDFSPAEARELAALARGRPIVMTRKDAVKLRPLLPPGPAEAYVLEQRVRMEEAERFEERVLAHLARESSG